MQFKNREGSNLNRKKLRIISQSPTEMCVLMEENGNITQEGTALSAEVFNEFQQTIDTSKNQSSSAISVANSASDIANEAKSNSLNAIENANAANSASSTALNIANSAKSIANEAKTNSDSAISSINSLSQIAEEAKSNSNIAKSKADSAYQKSEEALNTAYAVRNDFNSLNDISSIISPDIAYWACSEVNTLPTSFGINDSKTSNIKFSSNGDYKTNVVIDGDYYGKDGQKKVAYQSDIPTKTSSLTNDSNFATTSYIPNRILDNGLHNETSSGTTGNSPTDGMLHSSGLYLTKTYNDPATPIAYGNIINIASNGSGQLLCGWSGSDSTTAPIYYRSHRDTSTGGWGPWKEIAYTENFLSKSGGTLDGNLKVNGDINCSGYINANSDIRLKEHIEKIDSESVKNIIEKTEIKAFNYISNGNRTIGVIAQDLQDKFVNDARFT